jgi:magnesium-protoporphyrin O-methyltransferase
MDPQGDGCCFDGWAVANAKRAREKGVGAKITADLLEALGSDELEGRSVLDLGCGSGDLALATLARGATRATGIDLGRMAIREAESLATERGLSDRSRFMVGDAARVSLDRHDVVVLNRVLCCYREIDALLANALSATEHVFAFTAPFSTGLTGLFSRIETRVANVWYRLRERKFRGFRTYVHDLAAADRRIRDAGFRPVVEGRRRVVWHLAVYERAA